MRLESHDNTSSCVRKLNLDDSDSSSTTDPAVILDQLKSFYSSVYKRSVFDEEQAMVFLNNPDIPKLDDESKEKCEGKLTFNERFRPLHTLQNSKAPGNDGLTVEFYKTFLPLVGNLVVGCSNEAYDSGELS